MKKAHLWLVLILIYCTVLYAQFFDIYLHYFEFTNADKISLGLSLVVPFVLSYRFLKTTNLNFKIIGSGLLIIIPIIIHPVISKLLVWSDYTWILMHIMIAIGGGIIASIRAPLWILPSIMSVTWAWAVPYHYEQNQLKYSDKVIAAIETRKGSGQIVQWKSDYWLHYNGELQFSTIDHHIFSEAFIQPIMHLDGQVRNVLIVGGDNGLLAEELSKFDSIYKIVVLPYDKDYSNFISEHYETLRIKRNEKVELVNSLSQNFLADTTSHFDLILIDLPTPRKVEFRQYYSEAFYKLCFSKLNPNGSMVTKTVGSYPEFGRIEEVQKNIQSAGFSQLAYHTQIPTLGQYSWTIGSKIYSSEEMLSSLKIVRPRTSTKWWNLEAMKMMLSFGKTSYFSDMVGQSVPL